MRLTPDEIEALDAKAPALHEGGNNAGVEKYARGDVAKGFADADAIVEGAQRVMRVALNRELERVFDICHGCRRCVSLCQSFPTLFDLVDASSTLEVDGVDKKDYWKVVDQCYLCDTCYMTKCPYVPPHAWNLDFPHLMLRAKAVKHSQGLVPTGERFLASTDVHGSFAGIPVVAICETPLYGVNAFLKRASDIAITTAYFLPSRRLLEQLIQADQRGARVRLLLAGRIGDVRGYAVGIPAPRVRSVAARTLWSSVTCRTRASAARTGRAPSGSSTATATRPCGRRPSSTGRGR